MVWHRQSKNEFPIFKATLLQNRAKKNLRILMLCDLAHTTQTVIDHIAAFKSNDDFNIVKVNPIVDRTMDVDLETFDVIIIHYSIFILSDYFLSKDWKKYFQNLMG